MKLVCNALAVSGSASTVCRSSFWALGFSNFEVLFVDAAFSGMLTRMVALSGGYLIMGALRPQQASNYSLPICEHMVLS